MRHVKVTPIKVSIIVPVYNVQQFLRECLESIIVQTLQEIEIICIDDGSTDFSGNILDEYEKKDERILVLHKKNTGYGHSVNVGMDMASGEYIGIVESDDYILPDMMRSLYVIAKTQDSDIVKADYIIFKGDGKERQHEYQYLDRTKRYYNKRMNAIKEKGVFDVGMFTWAGIYKHSFLKQNHIKHNQTPGASYQDNGFWFQTISLAKTVYFMPQSFYCLRRDNASSSCYSTSKVYCICDEYDFIKDFLDHHKELSKEFMLIHNLYRFRSYMWTLSRIHKDYVYEFMKRFYIDLEQEIKEQNIDLDLFTSFEKKQLEGVLSHSRECYYQIRFQMSQYTLEWLRRYESIVIYGAGKIGSIVAERLKKAEIVIAGFAVTQNESNLEEIQRLPVKTIDEWNDEKKKLGIIISVGEQLHDEVEQELKKREIKDFIYWNTHLTDQ